MAEDFSERVSESLHLRVDDLPTDVAQQIRHAQSQDPDFLRRILLYGVTHKAVFETLSNAGWT